MIVPDNAIFSTNPWDGGNINYGEARKIIDDKKKLELVQARLDALFIRQVKPIAVHDNYKPSIWSPFPLTSLTFLGIETLGRVIGDKDKISKDNFETSKRFSRPIYKRIDAKLLSKPTKVFYEKLEARLGKNDKKSISSYCDMFHKFMRNTFTHGYQGLLVFLNHEQKEGWTIIDGFLVLNPYWFWDRFVIVYNDIFSNLLTKPDKQLQQNAIKYFDDLVR